MTLFYNMSIVKQDNKTYQPPRKMTYQHIAKISIFLHSKQVWVWVWGGYIYPRYPSLYLCLEIGKNSNSYPNQIKECPSNWDEFGRI